MSQLESLRRKVRKMNVDELEGLLAMGVAGRAEAFGLDEAGHLALFASIRKRLDRLEREAAG
jgi:hypothetical protein